MNPGHRLFTHKYDVVITLTEEMLGTAAADPDIHKKHVLKKFIDGGGDPGKVSEEMKALPDFDEMLDKQKTVFYRTNTGRPAFFNYVIKGYFKEVCSSLRNVSTTESSDLTSFKKKIDGQVFVFPRVLEITLPKGKKVTECSRPLRAQTMKGERVSLVTSEAVPAGSQVKFTVCTVGDFGKSIAEWLDYGELKGLLQWRSGGKGTFTYKITGGKVAKKKG